MHFWPQFGNTDFNLWWFIARTSSKWGKFWLFSLIWPWSSRSIIPKNNRDLNRGLLHLCVGGRPKTCTKRSQVRGVRPHVPLGLHWLKFVFHLPGVARDVRQRCTHLSASWGWPDSSWRHHETRPRVVWRYITCVFWETDAVACVWRGFGRPLPPLIRHLARWPNIKLGWPQPLWQWRL